MSYNSLGMVSLYFHSLKVGYKPKRWIVKAGGVSSFHSLKVGYKRCSYEEAVGAVHVFIP